MNQKKKQMQGGKLKNPDRVREEGLKLKKREIFELTSSFGEYLLYIT